MNTINDELLACYVEGTATPEEQILVRDYLTKNPEEYERVLYMMDLDRDDYLSEQIENTSNILPLKESPITHIACSAAAFAPQEKKLLVKNTRNSLKINGLPNRLSELLREIE